METISTLFVYGNLLDAQLREKLLGRAVRVASATLPNYERRRGRYYYVVKLDGAQTPGQILEGLSADDFTILDRYEDAPRLYVREKVDVISEQGTNVNCWIYVPSEATLDSFL
ncbi:MAG TPA: gamma-glutamylcyclotransferase family protein [Bradyrhizobium sp.]|nr:gamma-glutamylcyclotransferase family protein [Candidatus Binataceae bacterium]HUN99128.1 gamma-glutamylcyclotransferase family protein [Bradyrhizobium sp.]